MSIRQFAHTIIPDVVFQGYHFVLAFLGDLLYGMPSKKLIVLGITGTKGKTTTCVYLTEILNKAGYKTAMLTTAEFRIGEQREQNLYKQTMLGRFRAHRFLKQALKEGCTHVVIETSSEGIVQSRHRRIRYDAAAITNLTPEHLEAHGGFDAYKSAKLKFFEYTAGLPEKKLESGAVPRVFVVNADDEHASSFLGVARKAKDAKVAAFGKVAERTGASSVFVLSHIESLKEGVRFRLNDTDFSISLLGEFNGYNAACAACVASFYGVSLSESAKHIADVQIGLGRMEYIQQGQPFSVIVDYAHEPTSYEKTLSAVRRATFRDYRVLALIGSAGGGRDASRQPVLGEIAAEYANLIVVSNEDPYDDDPQTIIHNVASGAEKTGMVKKENLFEIFDRREAINFLLSKAREEDTVVLLGKGCEPWIVVADNKKVAWDERKVVREELEKLGYKENGVK